MNPIFCDFETQSPADLTEVGGRLYVEHPDTRVLSAVFLIDNIFHVCIPHWRGRLPELEDRDVKSFGVLSSQCQFHFGPNCFDFLKSCEDRVFVAHNAAGFDVFVHRRFINPRCTYIDTLFLARAGGFPGPLEKLSQQCFGRGKHAAAKSLLKLTKATHDADGECVYPSISPGDMRLMVAYNIGDVALLRDLWYGPLANVEIEADVITANLTINDRGVLVDVPLVRAVQAISDYSAAHADEQIVKLTNGEIPYGKFRSTKVVHDWLESKGVRIAAFDSASQEYKKTLRRDAVDRFLADPESMADPDSPFYAHDNIDPVVFDVLRLRAQAMKITGAKAKRALFRASADGRARDLFSYHHAHTGRWSSRGIQVHNLPRGHGKIDTDAVLASFARGEWSSAEAGFNAIQQLLPPNHTVDQALSNLLRPMFHAAPGKTLLIADYSQIEGRCLAWMAGQEDLLEVFRNNGDVYCSFASRMFGREITEADKIERQVGKVATLGLGFSMGPEKFALFCAAVGVNLASVGLSPVEVVEMYRNAYPAIAGVYSGSVEGRAFRRGGLWYDLMAAAKNAMNGGVHHAGKCVFWYEEPALIVQLPSGRKLMYQNARIEDQIPGYALGWLDAKPRPTLVYDNPRGYTASLYPGKICENVVQAACRDLMATAIVNMEAAGIPIVMHVHDEIVAEVDLTSAEANSIKQIEIMKSVPHWASGFPIDVKGHISERFTK